MTSNQKSYRKLKARCIRLGICMTCKSVNDGPYLKCSACREEFRLYTERRDMKHIAMGNCPQCKQELTQPPVRNRWKRIVCVYCMNWRKIRIRAGMCSCCCKRRPRPGRKYCRPCVAKLNPPGMCTRCRKNRRSKGYKTCGRCRQYYKRRRRILKR